MADLLYNGLLFFLLFSNSDTLQAVWHCHKPIWYCAVAFTAFHGLAFVRRVVVILMMLVNPE
jgi:hypothetical protein